MAVSHAVHHQYDQPIGIQQNFFQVEMAPQVRKSI